MFGFDENKTVAERDQDRKRRYYAILISGVVIVSIFLLYPLYNVWASEQGGRASLANAEYSKQVAVQEARAKLDSSKLLAEAEVERAKGVAQANQIIGESLKGHTEYLQYLWITQLEKSTHETIYVPTESQIPILEAGRNVKNTR